MTRGYGGAYGGDGGGSGGGGIENKHSTDVESTNRGVKNKHSTEPGPRVCMSIHPACRSCSDLGSRVCSQRPFCLAALRAAGLFHQQQHQELVHYEQTGTGAACTRREAAAAAAAAAVAVAKPPPTPCFIEPLPLSLSRRHRGASSKCRAR